MKWIIGLGNPGRQYEATAHNVGFRVADELARRWQLSFRPALRVKAELAEGLLAGTPATLVKPMTYMNLSGEAVGALTRQTELGPDDLVALTDDVNLPLGRLRIRSGGSHGGHNGLRSLIERLGTDQFARVRVGVAPPWPIENLTEFVLSKLPPLEREQLKEMIEVAADAVETWIAGGSDAAARKFNGLKRFADSG